MKKTYTEPKLDLVRMDADVITSSYCPNELDCDGD